MRIETRESRRPKRRLLCEQAYVQLKQAVIKGKLEADERLIETRLAEKLGISRTPVREAIHRLEQEGLLYKLSSGGHAVSPATEKDLRDTTGVSGTLLGYAAYLATSNATCSDLNMLRRITEKAAGHLENGNHQEFVKACDRFCSTLLLLSGNKRLHAIFTGFGDHLSRQLFGLHDIGEKYAFLHDQRVLIDLMEARRASRAEKLVRAILAGNRDKRGGRPGTELMGSTLKPAG